MWMARKQEETLQEAFAELGQVTLAGPGTGVALAGERRNVRICLPGGYHWTPGRGDTVLVVKSGPEQAPCVVGAEDGDAPEAGEVYLSVASGAGIRLRKDGVIELEGDLRLAGRLDVTGELIVNGQEV